MIFFKPSITVNDYRPIRNFWEKKSHLEEESVEGVLFVHYTKNIKNSYFGDLLNWLSDCHRDYGEASGPLSKIKTQCIK